MGEARGLLIDGQLRDVPGLTIYAPASAGGPDFNFLDPGDYAMRPTTWIRIVVVHSTGGKWPQPIHAGSGPPGHARDVIDMWSGQDRGGRQELGPTRIAGEGKRVHSGAHLVVDYDRTIYCTADLARCAAYHAEGANPYAVGIEMCTLPGGGIYEATLDATAQLCAALTWGRIGHPGLLPVPFQIPGAPYRNAPLNRCETGSGPSRHQLSPSDLVGIIGHRENTSERGYGDPGEEIVTRLAALGAEAVDYDAREEQTLARQRQARLNQLDARDGLTLRPLVVDGIVGPASIAAMARRRFDRWRDV